MATQELNAPVLGAGGEPCHSCGAPLAADQRYCLSCGARRTDARLPFRDILAGRPPRTATAATAAAAPPPAPARTRANLTVLGALGCLLLALGIGVLIGRGSDGGSPGSPPPAQVITVGGGAPAATTTPGADGSSPAPKSTAGAAGSAKKHAKGSSAGASAKSAKNSHATNKSLQKLQKLAPKDYQKQSQKLPKTLGTGGKAPPKDNKPAAGGGSFQEIG